MRYNKGAIELSANFIIVIIISIVIMTGGFLIFNSLRNKATSYVQALDSQTKDRLKSMMLSDNLDVAVYPSDITISGGNSGNVGLGITNNGDDAESFYAFSTIPIQYFADSEANPSTPSPNPVTVIYSTSADTSTYLGSALPKQQLMKSILLKLDSSAPKGQYVVTFKVKSSPSSTGCVSPCNLYGQVKIYINNP